MPAFLFPIIKHLHVWLATLSFIGFVVRLLWHYKDSPQLEKRITKVLPHIIDSLLFASGIAMAITLQYSPFAVDWLGYKMLSLLCYIGFGILAFKAPNLRTPASFLAILAFFFTAYLAVNKLA